MNHYVAGILRIVLLEALAALVLVDHLFRPARARRLYVALAALSVFAFCNFGSLRGPAGLVHHWEQYHFYLGSKYLPELGYFDLYKATVLADRESAHRLDGIREVRRLEDFELVPIGQALEDGARVRAAFTDERWAAFKADWTALSRVDVPWAEALRDHGNSASPAWAILAYPIAHLLPVTQGSQEAIALFDLGLMAGLFAFVFATFGVAAGCVALSVFSLTPFCFDYLAGSFLRWDWLFALGLAVCFARRAKPLTAGLCLGYAVASKLFPIFFAGALGLRALWEVGRTRRLPPRHLRFAAGLAAGLALSVAVSSVILRKPGLWLEYERRIDVARLEKFYPNQYSLRTVYLQVVESSFDELRYRPFTPRVVKQGLPGVDVRSHRTGLLACQLLLTALLAVGVRRSEDWEALCLGPFLVLVLLVVNAYYWNMLALTALALFAGEPRTRGALAGLIGLLATFGTFYLYQHLDHAHSEGYLVAVLLLGVLLTWGVLQVVDERRRSPGVEAARRG